jgi:hypothetical protein
MESPAPLLALLLVLLFAPLSCSLSATSQPLKGSCLDASKRATSPSTNNVVKIRWDDWETTQLTSMVAAIILQERMGLEVQFVSSSGPTKDVYEKVASGEVDAAFEVWPAGREKLFNKYASFNTSGDKPVQAFKYPLLYGRSGISELCHRRPKSGKGMCKPGFPSTPQNLASVLATSSGVDHFNASASLAVPSSASKALCAATPSYGCDADGIYRTAACKVTPNSCVPLFHATPQWDTGLIEGLVERLGVPVAISYVGIDRLWEIAWEGYEEGFGGLFYTYEPGANIHGLALGDFPRASLKPGVDLPNTAITRLVRKDGPVDVYAFVTKFDLTKGDYAELAATESVMNDIHSTACDWLKKHEDVWETWVSFPSRSSISFGVCTEGFCLSGCWTGFFLQIVLAFIVFYAASWVDINEREGKVKFGRTRACSTAEAVRRTVSRHKLTEGEDSDCLHDERSSLQNQPALAFAEVKPHLASSSSAKEIRSLISKVKHDLHLDGASAAHQDRVAFEKALATEANFICHVRSLRNFTRSNLDANLTRPPSYLPSRWVEGFDRRAIYHYIMTTDAFMPVFLQTLGVGLLSSALGSLFYLLLYHEVYKFDDAAFRAGHIFSDDSSIAHVISMTGIATRDITNSFKFLPSFLLIGYVGYSVGRWRKFQSYGYSIQGRIHDIGAMVGGSLKQPEQPETKEFAFRIYRYLNLVHLLVYKSKSPWLCDLTSDDMVSLGLLTREEVKVLEPMKNKMRDTVIGWLFCEVQSAIGKDICEGSMGCSCIDNIGYLRGKCAAYHDAFETNHPNLWVSLMTGVVDMLVFLYAVGTPLTAFVFELGCFQPYCLAFTVFLSLPFLCCSRLLKQLGNPYAGSHDTFNVDSLMASSEQCIFASLRSKFDLSKLASVARDVGITSELASVVSVSPPSMKNASFEENNTIHPTTGVTTAVTPPTIVEVEIIASAPQLQPPQPPQAKLIPPSQPSQLTHYTAEFIVPDGLQGGDSIAVPGPQTHTHAHPNCSGNQVGTGAGVGAGAGAGNIDRITTVLPPNAKPGDTVRLRVPLSSVSASSTPGPAPPTFI